MSTSVSATTTGPPLAHLAHVLTQLVRFLGRERPEHRKGALDPLLVFHRRGACGDREPPKVRGHGNALGLGARARDGELLRGEPDADRLFAGLRLLHDLHCSHEMPTEQPSGEGPTINDASNARPWRAPGRRGSGPAFGGGWAAPSARRARGIRAR